MFSEKYIYGELTFQSFKYKLCNSNVITEGGEDFSGWLSTKAEFHSFDDKFSKRNQYKLGKQGNGYTGSHNKLCRAYFRTTK